MATSRTQTLVQHLRRAAGVSNRAGLSDGQLLNQYISTRDEEAFEAIVRRHGPMVLGVCRRILRDQHEADDAFQATFMVLVRKAASVVPQEMVGNFLYGVAHQTAVRARSVAAKRRLRERHGPEIYELSTRQADPFDDLRPLLDQELVALPGKYRVAVVLCDLEGKTHKEAARHLGWPVGTLASRLFRGRKMLAARLSRRGVLPSSGALAVVLPENLASAGVPAWLVSSTVKAVSLYHAGPAAASGAISLKVAALTEGVLKVMSMNKIKTVVAVLFLAGMAVLGGGMLSHKAAADQPGDEKQAIPMQSAPKAVADAGEQPAVAPLPKPKESKARLEITVEGKQVRVLAVFEAGEFSAIADRISYDEERHILILEATEGGSVRVQKQRGKDQVPEIIEGKKAILNRKTGTISVYGPGKIEQDVPVTGKIGLAVPMLGPVPVSLDFGFPVVKQLQDSQQVFNFFMGFVR